MAVISNSKIKMEELKVRDIIKERYTLMQFLGNGSFGEVWFAHDLLSGRDVALKIYRKPSVIGVLDCFD